MALRIGLAGWRDDLMAITAPFGDSFWAGFRPCEASQMRELESRIGRALPSDFVEFYRAIGFGQFRDGSQLYSPDEILQCLGAPIYFVLGSSVPGAEWCTEDDHRRLWLTRGADNPAPSRFTQDVLTLDGIPLYDLLQVGSDGSCCYHQLHVGPNPRPFEYCLLTDSQTLENTSQSFSAGLEKILASYAEDERA